MIGSDSKVLLPNGDTIAAGNVKGGIQVSDLYGEPQMVKKARSSSEKEYQVLQFENGVTFYCLTYLSIMTWDSEIDAMDLKAGDKVLGYRDGKLCEIAVTDALSVNVVNKKRLKMPRKVKMTFFETYEDMPIVADEIVIGMRKQLGDNTDPHLVKLQK